jgi:CheY-like chemotaxis protein
MNNLPKNAEADLAEAASSASRSAVPGRPEEQKRLEALRRYDVLGTPPEEAFDALLIDIDLGGDGEDGVGLLRRLRAMGGRVGRAPAIAFAAYAMPGDTEHYCEAGFEGSRGISPSPSRKPTARNDPGDTRWK